MAMLVHFVLDPSAITIFCFAGVVPRKIPSFTQCSLSMKAIPVAPVSSKIRQGTVLIVPWNCKECLSVVYLMTLSYSLCISMTNIRRGIIVPLGVLHVTSDQPLTSETNVYSWVSLHYKSTFHKVVLLFKESLHSLNNSWPSWICKKMTITFFTSGLIERAFSNCSSSNMSYKTHCFNLFQHILMNNSKS